MQTVIENKSMTEASTLGTIKGLEMSLGRGHNQYLNLFLGFAANGVFHSDQNLGKEGWK